MSDPMFKDMRDCWRQAMRRLWLVGVVGILVSVMACVPPFSTKNESDVILRVTSIEATAGGDGTGGSTLISDVVSDEGAVFNDNATVNLEAILKNPLITDVGQFNDVQLTNYTV